MKKSKRLLFSGVCAIALSIIFLITGSTKSDIAATVSSVGFAFIAIGLLIYFRGEETVQQDERTKKVNNLAMAYSWWCTYLLIAVLFWVDRYKLLVAGIDSYLGLILFFMVLVYSFAAFILNKMPDV